MCMILPCLLAPDTMAIVFTPLKRLQAVQVLSFARYQIKAIAINEDTPNDPALWKVCTLGMSASDLSHITETLGHQRDCPRLDKVGGHIGESRQPVLLSYSVHLIVNHFAYNCKGMRSHPRPEFPFASIRRGSEDAIEDQ
jgi:hypothetical protein